MTIPANVGELWPPLGQTVDSANALIATRSYLPPMDYAALSHAALRTFLGFTSGGGNVDDANNILATQVYGP